MIGRDPDVRGATGDHAKNGRDDAADRADFPALGVARLGKRVVVPEQLVGAVEEIYVHRGIFRGPHLQMRLRSVYRPARTSPHGLHFPRPPDSVTIPGACARQARAQSTLL